MIPVFIICRDRFSCTLELINWLERSGNGERIYLIDNDSTYEPLLNYYQSTNHNVIRTNENYGHLAPWSLGLIEKYAKDEYYIVSDPDVVPVDECPLDMFDHCRFLLNKYSDRNKIGPNLKIDDIPDHYKLKSKVIAWESQFLRWKSPEPGVLFAPIDTTLALYKPNVGQDISYSMRTLHPYIARHTPWYVDSENLSDEEKHYRSRLNSGISNWNK